MDTTGWSKHYRRYRRDYRKRDNESAPRRELASKALPSVAPGSGCPPEASKIGEGPEDPKLGANFIAKELVDAYEEVIRLARLPEAEGRFIDLCIHLLQKEVE